MAGMNKKQLEAALSEAMEKVQQQKEELERLSKGRRPADALIIGTNLTFQKGTHQELVGKRLKLRVPQEAVTLHISATAKRNKNGNVYLWATGWIDTSQLDLRSAEGGEDETTANVTKSAKEALGL